MWPAAIDWQQLRFGVEIEFVGGAPKAVPLLPGWVMALDELQRDDLGHPSGSELKPGPITWADREQIRTMLERLKATGAQANWSCGLHVHVDLGPWGEELLLPLMDGALIWQEAFSDLLQTSAHRQLYCPPVLPEMRTALAEAPSRAAVCRRGDPESHRCGINLGAWWDFGTVEIRFANGSLDFEEICRTVELCLRFVTAVGADRLAQVWAQEGAPGAALASALGAPTEGYPPATPCPPWRWDQIFLATHLRPVLEPLVAVRYPDGEILAITPTASGFQLSVEFEDSSIRSVSALPTPTGWHLAE